MESWSLPGRAWEGRLHVKGTGRGWGLWGLELSGQRVQILLPSSTPTGVLCLAQGPAWCLSSAPHPGSTYSSPSRQALNWIYDLVLSSH